MTVVRNSIVNDRSLDKQCNQGPLNLTRRLTDWDWDWDWDWERVGDGGRSPIGSRKAKILMNSRVETKYEGNQAQKSESQLSSRGTASGLRGQGLGC